MIHVVCGLIGAGKSTYAKKQSGFISDVMEGDSPNLKGIQLEATLKAADPDVWHITCFPTLEEIEAFNNLDAEYIWINTTLAQAMLNVVVRGRERDLEDLNEVGRKNTDILYKYVNSDIRFRVVDVFETGERW